MSTPYFRVALQAIREGRYVLARAVCDAAGAFRLPCRVADLPAMLAVVDGQEDRAGWLWIDRVGDEPVEVALVRPAAVQVRLVDPSSPVVLGQVHLVVMIGYHGEFGYPGHGEPSADGRGKVWRLTDLIPGRYAVGVDASNYVNDEQEFEVGDGESTECTILLRRGVTLTGAVVRGDGQPLREGVLELRPRWVGARLPRAKYGTSDSEGRFHVDGIEPGFLGIVIKSNWGGEVLGTTEVTVDGLRPITLRLTDDATARMGRKE